MKRNKNVLAPSVMGELMANLLLVADAWYQLAEDTVPGRYRASDRYEVLGLLTRLLVRRFHGLRDAPSRHGVIPVVTNDSVGLRIRSPGRVPADAEVLERQLMRFGFRIEDLSGSSRREILLVCTHVEGAKVLAFPMEMVAEAKKAK